MEEHFRIMSSPGIGGTRGDRSASGGIPPHSMSHHYHHYHHPKPRYVNAYYLSPSYYPPSISNSYSDPFYPYQVAEQEKRSCFCTKPKSNDVSYPQVCVEDVCGTCIPRSLCLTCDDKLTCKKDS